MLLVLIATSTKILFTNTYFWLHAESNPDRWNCWWMLSQWASWPQLHVSLLYCGTKWLKMQVLSILLNASLQHYTPSDAFASFSLDSKTFRENRAKTPDENLNTISHLSTNTLSSQLKAGFYRKVFDTIPESTSRQQNFDATLVTPPSGSYLIKTGLRSVFKP